MRTSVWLWGAAPACPSSPVMGVVSHGWEAYLLGRLHSLVLLVLLVLLLVVHVARHAPAQSHERGPSDMSTGERQSFARGSDSHLYVGSYRSGDVVPDSADCFFFRGMSQPSQLSLPAPPLCVRVSLHPHQSSVWTPPVSCMEKGPSQGDDEGLDLPLLPHSRALFRESALVSPARESKQ